MRMHVEHKMRIASLFATYTEQPKSLARSAPSIFSMPESSLVRRRYCGAIFGLGS